MDRISEQTLAAVISSVERAAITPPDDLTGAARAMFVEIAESNRSRPWNRSHAHALADFCRVSVMWREQQELTEREGPVVDGKVNPRLRAARLLLLERGQLSRLLGLQVDTRARLLQGRGKENANAREIGAALVQSKTADGGDLLA